MKTKIRNAESADFNWVEDLMQNALKDYYGGDHRAHAKRILNAHLSGGTDYLGFFSFEQRMFVIEVDGIRGGIIHIVGKRQSTYKISPLIIFPEFRGKLGLGTLLLDFAETYAKKHDARQIYCTVAKQNISALQFFLRKGFIRAGESESHYKGGINEVMLYKPLHDLKSLTSFDSINVSVVPLDESNEEIKRQTAELLLNRLCNSFDGITSDWVSSLFDGYARRHTKDINAKYKLIFVALDGNGQVIGVAGATPKKGNPIKIMPLITSNISAFEALLIDTPFQLVPYGHKLYIHINPTVDEVISLQRLGWKLDAAMPSAYHPDVITQQWSLNIGESTMKTMRIKQKYFDLIRFGKKTLEVRVGYESIKRIKVGERIQLGCHVSTQEVKVVEVRNYSTFEDMLTNEDWKLIVPDARSKGEVLSLLRQIYPKNKEVLGVIVLEFEKPSEN
ncbi:MAG: GNAT family N-acetyltransferase [Candidatus Paceibacterota bacterium]